MLADLPIPNLSGEWSDDPTPEELRHFLGASEVEWTLAGDELMMEWEYFAQSEYLTTLEDILIGYVAEGGTVSTQGPSTALVPYVPVAV